MITAVRKVIVPVADQEAARRFWSGIIGFRVVRDDAYGGERWIEVKPPDQDLLLVLSLRGPDEPGREEPAAQPAEAAGLAATGEAS
jgi:catechol 2,3-dioxygenase-like lactoylglutathione lyase family enzyme